MLDLELEAVCLQLYRVYICVCYVTCIQYVCVRAHSAAGVGKAKGQVAPPPQRVSLICA